MEEIQPKDQLFCELRERIQRGIVEHALPSLAIAIAQGQSILWEEGFGWADRERRIPATPHTMYSLASITKPITMTGVMILKERGLLDLDRPINEYLGGSKLRARVGNADDATVRRVANHTSGLPLHYQFFYQDEPYQPPTRDETIRRYGNLITAPGERYQYSNLGYGILDEVISRLSGKSYSEFLREEVFLPLGMIRASVDIGPGLSPFVAQRYESDGELYPFYTFDHPGASAVHCSAHDLLRFGMFHLKLHLPDQKAILSDEALDEMQNLDDETGERGGYGLGWGIDDGVQGYRLVVHDGGMGGVRTCLWLLPSAKIAVVVLTNTNGGDQFGSEVGREALSLLLPDFGERHAQHLAQMRAQQEETRQQKGTFKPDTRLLGSWSGYVQTYQDRVPLKLWFQESGDVHAQLGTELKTLVNDVQFSGEGYLKGKMMGDIGTPDASRRPHHLHLDLKLRDDLLNGALIAISIEDRLAGAPGRRCENALSHWAELRKTL